MKKKKLLNHPNTINLKSIIFVYMNKYSCPMLR
jgi:hypothetical protein